MPDLFRVKRQTVYFEGKPGPVVTEEQYFSDRAEAKRFVEMANESNRLTSESFSFWKGPTKYKVPKSVVDLVLDSQE